MPSTAPISAICLTFLALVSPARLALATRTPEGKDSVPRGVYFQNNHPMPMHISNDWAAKDMEMFPDLEWMNKYVEPGDHVFMPAPKSTSPKYYIGPTPNNRTAYVDGRRNHNTAVEATYDSWAGHTYYDIDIEKGFSVPVWCHGAKDDWHSGEGCISDVLAHCPERDRHIDVDTGIYDYCRGTDNPESVALRAHMCPGVYTVFNDDKATTTVSKGHVLRCDIMDPKATELPKAAFDKKYFRG